MSSKSSKRLVANLDVIPFVFEQQPSDFNWVICPHCHEVLSLHQPDSQSPSRILGFCEGCRRWYLVLVELKRNEARMILLPESELFQAIWNSNEVFTSDEQGSISRREFDDQNDQPLTGPQNLVPKGQSSQNTTGNQG